MSLLTILTGQETFSPTYDSIKTPTEKKAEAIEEAKRRAREATAAKRAESDAAYKKAFGTFLRSAQDVADVLGIRQSTAYSQLVALERRNKVIKLGEYLQSGKSRPCSIWKWKMED